MSDETEQATQADEDTGRSLASVHTLELATAFVICVFAAVVIVSNYRLGAGWDANGPQSGYFPFYVGVILFISGAAVFIGELRKGGAGEVVSFVDSRPFVRVLQILIPTIIFVIGIIYLGIYVSTAIFISTFMVWLGRYRVIVAVALGIGIALALFFTFEVWFLVPLPKGPLETLFGY
jgi:hypothetical protein